MNNIELTREEAQELRTALFWAVSQLICKMTPHKYNELSLKLEKLIVGGKGS